MAHITLTEEQARLIVGQPGEIEVLDPAGRLLGFLSWSDERSMLERARRRRGTNQRRFSSERVEAILRRLHEAAEAGLDKAALRDLFQQLRAGEG